MSAQDNLSILMNILAEEGLESENLLKRFARAKSLGNKTSSLQAINTFNTQKQPILSPITPEPYQSTTEQGIMPTTAQNSPIIQ